MLSVILPVQNFSASSYRINQWSLTENATFKADNLLLLGPEPADADTVDEYEERLLAEPIGPHDIEPETLKENAIKLTNSYQRVCMPLK